MAEIPVYHPHTKKQIGAIVANGKFQTISRTGPKTSPKHYEYDENEDLSSHPGGPEGLVDATAHIIANHDKTEAHEAKVAGLIAAARRNKKTNEGTDVLSNEEIDAITEEALCEYHMAGTVGGQPFAAHTSDAYDERSIGKQNPHLSPSHVKAIQAHTETPEFEDGDEHTSSKQHGHTVKITHNGGYFDESVNEGIADFIGSAVNEDPVSAQDFFNGIIASKISALMDAKRQEVGGSMFKVQRIS